MSNQEVTLRGVGVAPGIAHGVVFLHHPDDEEPPKRKLDELDRHAELQRALHDLKTERDRILAEKTEVAEKVRRFGPTERAQLSAAEVARRYGPDHCANPPGN